MHVIDQAEQTRQSLQEAIDKLSRAVEKTLDLIARTQSENIRDDFQSLCDAYRSVDEQEAFAMDDERPSGRSDDRT